MKVYRAPGGALPNSFWARDPHTGVQGGLELAFMSTTVDKEEAMKYARRAPGMILFEIQQGFVARGASVAWLSQVCGAVRLAWAGLRARVASLCRRECSRATGLCMC